VNGYKNSSVNSYSRERTIIVCDTNVFIDDVGETLWDALLAAQITVLPTVYKELQNVWLDSPRYNSRVRNLFVQSFQTKDDKAPFLFEQLPVDDYGQVRQAVGYYVNVLAQRKRAMEYVSAIVRTRTGRDPDPAELQRLANHHCGERGYQLAKRAAQNPHRPFPFADEELVVTSAFMALLTGNELVLLTRDAGIQEQFYKFVWLLDTHYRGMLLAEDFARDPQTYQAVNLAAGDPRISPAFVGSTNLLLRRTPERYDELLPDDDTPLPLHCILLGSAGEEKVAAPIVFCPDRRGLCRLIWTKGSTGGLNTDLLDGLNCHPFLFPLSFHPLGSYAAVARDQVFSFGGNLQIPWLDIHQAVFESERFRRVVIGEEGTSMVDAI
jgi:hypothetical protein